MQNVALSLVTAPTAEPITLNEAKAWLRVEFAEDDPLIEACIATARQFVENQLRRQIMTATWKLGLDRFPYGQIELPLPPTQSVTSITYIDNNGDSQTLSSALYALDVLSEPARIRPVSGEDWPDTDYEVNNAVVVEFVAGWASVVNVPQAIKTAIKLMVTHFYDHRSPTVEGMASTGLMHSLKSLIWQYKMPEIASLAS